MDPIRRGRHTLIAVLLGAALAAGAVPAVAGAAVAAPPPPATGAVPADWPADVALPAGQLQGSTGGGGLWTVEFLVNGSAAEVMQSALDFYRAAGFATVSDGVLVRGTHQLTLVVENRDHSPTHTFLVLGLQEIPAQPATGTTSASATPGPAPAAPDPAPAAPDATTAPAAPAVPDTSSVAPAPTAGGAAAAAAGLPPDWPADIPLPAGTVQGSTGGAGQWSVQLLVRGSAAEALKSTVAFYVARGFRAESNATVVRGGERIVVVTENRDHSPTETTVVLGVSASGAARPVLVATLLPGPATVRLARAHRSGLRVRFTAPAGTRSARVRAYRMVRGGGRRLAGSATVAAHRGRNALTLSAAGFRRRLVTGTYVLEVVLRGAGGAAGRPASARVRVVRR